MATLTVIIFIFICSVIFYFSPITDIIGDIRSKYSICSYYTLVEVVDKNISTKYNRLIFEITTQLKDTTLISEVTPKDFNKVKIGDKAYIFINDNGTRVCDICLKDEIDQRIKVLTGFPLKIDIKEMGRY